MKARLIAGDRDGALEDAEWALDAGAGGSESPIGRYAAVLGHLVRGEDGEAAALAPMLESREDFPAAVAGTLAALAAGDPAGYEESMRALVADFEARDEFLEDVPVADTVLALQALGARRGLSVPVGSHLLPT